VVVTLEVDDKIKEQFLNMLGLIKNVKVLSQIDNVKHTENDYKYFLDRKNEEEISLEDVEKFINADKL